MLSTLPSPIRERSSPTEVAVLKLALIPRQRPVKLLWLIDGQFRLDRRLGGGERRHRLPCFKIGRALNFHCTSSFALDFDTKPRFTRADGLEPGLFR